MKAIHDNNFWEVNPELIILPEFEKIYENDKTKKKEISSKIMWAIYYGFTPESKYFYLPNKLEILKDSFIKEPKFNWEDYNKAIEVYKALVLSDAERALVEWGEIMMMRSSAMKKLYKDLLDMPPIDVDTKALKEVDSMLANTPKMFEDYKKVRKDYEEEKTSKKGKKNVSLSDSGDI